MRRFACVICLVLAWVVGRPSPALAEDWVDVDIGETVVRWNVQIELERVTLAVLLPNGKVVRQEVKGGEPVVFDVGSSARDGVYQYELRGMPRLDESVRKELLAARKNGNEFDVIESLTESGRLPPEAVRSGVFSVKGGVLVSPDPREDEDRAKQTASTPRQKAGSGIGIITAEDQVIPDDLIVQGSECVGFDCVNNESFSFDTIRLKENNLRIHFDDTSTQAGFPANDWRLIANDSASGGQSKFSIEDSTGARTPFTVEAGAATNSVYVDSTGRVGFRTSTPVLDLHVNTSNTPAIRLEQNNSGGFTAQTWDIGANEANFFIRDVTGGSRLSLRIRPGAPTSSIDISADGDVGVGTASPASSLHVLRSDGTSKLLVQETNGTATARELAEYRNNGDVVMIFKNSGSADRWSIGTTGTDFFWNNQTSANTEMQLNGASGNLLIEGNLTEGSSRDIKTNFAPLEPRDVLSRVTALPVSLWSYRTDSAVRHFGPVAEDFHQAFGLGRSNKGISPGDTAGIALAAIQGLNQEKDEEIAELKSRIEALEKLVQSLAQEAPKQ